MAFIFKEDETEKMKVQMQCLLIAPLPLWQEIVYMASMIGVLVFANWAKPDTAEDSGMAFMSSSGTSRRFRPAVYVHLCEMAQGEFLDVVRRVVAVALLHFFSHNTLLSFSTGIAFLVYAGKTSSAETKGGLMLLDIYPPDPATALRRRAIAGFCSECPGRTNGLSKPVDCQAVGGNSFSANLRHPWLGHSCICDPHRVPMYRAFSVQEWERTSPCVLLAGPALSLPSMIVIRSILERRILVFFGLVIGLSTIVGIFLDG